MPRFARMCFNWKVLIALGVVGFGIWTVAPNLLLKSLPLLLLAACPLTMLLMALGMKRVMGVLAKTLQRLMRILPNQPKLPAQSGWRS